MRYCVTGASGFIGANLVARLKAEGHWVRAVDIKETPHRAHLYEQADEVRSVDLRVWSSEIADCTRELFVDLRGDCDIDRIYHLAADHGGAGYFHGPADYKAARNNQLIDQNLLTAAMEQGIDRLFFASSACTYDTATQGKNAKPLKESDWYRGGKAEALYGETKRMSTLYFEGARQHGLDARSGLFHTIYGPTQDFEEPRAKFPTALCRKMIENPERVEVWGDGTQVRTFLYIEDALDRIQAVMELPYHGPVNIGSDEEVTVKQCAEWVAEAADASPEWVWTDGPTGVAHRASDNTTFNERYGEGNLTTARQGFIQLFESMAHVLA